MSYICGVSKADDRVESGVEIRAIQSGFAAGSLVESEADEGMGERVCCSLFNPLRGCGFGGISTTG